MLSQFIAKRAAFLALVALILALAGCRPAAAVPAKDALLNPTLPPATETPSPPTASPSPQPSPTATPSPSPTPTLTLPEEHYIRNIHGRRQYFALGCEAGAAVDWALYFGFEINEFEFQHRLPLSDNPDYGFVGSVNSVWGQVPPYAYGVHAGPVAALLREYGVQAEAVKGYTLEEIRRQIALERPVIAWVIGNVVGGVPYEYTDTQGRTSTVAAYEHVILVTGYNQKSIRYINNSNFYETPNEVFLNSWGVLGNMAVVVSAAEEYVMR